MNCYILDACAFILGLNSTSIKGRIYSVPAVADELPPMSMALKRFITSHESGYLKILQPSAKYHNEVLKTSRKLGESSILSKADLQIIALALELKTKEANPIIVTDDYAIQNVAEHLNLPYSPLATLGISYEFKWTFYCPACFRRYKQDYGPTTCEICGTKLKRKVVRKIERTQ